MTEDWDRRTKKYAEFKESLKAGEIERVPNSRTRSYGSMTELLKINSDRKFTDWELISYVDGGPFHFGGMVYRDGDLARVKVFTD